MPSTVIRTNRPTVFTTNLKAASLSNQKNNVTLENQAPTNISSTSSFRYDQIGAALKSTQELNVDYTSFENHVFFNSAVASVNVAFDRIVNNYPFDAGIVEIENFEDSLTGYERYILNLFPKNKNFLKFNGTSYLSVADSAGSTFSTGSRLSTGQGILDPADKSFAIECFVYPSQITNDCQIIAQKLKDSSNGITIALSSSTDTQKCYTNFYISHDGNYLTASAEINKGVFNHLYYEYNATPASGTLKIYKNLELVGQSEDSAFFGNLNFNASPLLIGSGSEHVVGTTTFTPKEMLSGAVDEFRLYHAAVPFDTLATNWKREIYAQSDLKLHFKFNEPTGSYGACNVALDYSGNSLHTYISNYTNALRTTSEITNPMSAEDIERCPVLFADFPTTLLLNQTLLDAAKKYDADNPNLITKLIPAHYLREGLESQGFSDEDGTIGDNFAGQGMPGTGVIGSPQIITAMLLVYAKFFDELKLFVDQFSLLVHADYDPYDSINDKFLPFLAKYYGFDLPSFFKGALSEQFYEGRNISQNDQKLKNGLDYARKQLWRRLLVNMSSIMREKGTVSSVRSLLNAVGIIPENFFTIREFGGPKKSFLEGRREVKSEVATMLDFSGSLGVDKGTTDSQGFYSLKPRIVGSFLSGSRIEVGNPEIAGSYVNYDNLVHGISNDESDGLMTSGSFAFEAMYKYQPRQAHFLTESLMRVHVTGTSTPSNTHGVVFNLTAVTGNVDNGAKVILYARPNSSTAVEPLSLVLTGVNVFDGDKWNITFGRQRNDELGYLTSSYYLRCAKNIDTSTILSFQTSSFKFYPASTDVLQNVTSQFNASGSFVVIGEQDIATSTRFLNNYDYGRENKFTGKVAQIRFWSKSLTNEEFLEHTRNYKSLGVTNPLINFSFDTESSGTFERLRVDVSTDQQVTQSDSSGNIVLFDFSQNKLIFNGAGFESNTRVIKPETFYYSYLSPHFDQSSTTNKIRVRSLQDLNNININTARLAPVYDVIRSEESQDDRRFLIEYSVVKALNEDIIRLLSDLDFFNNALGKPSYMYDQYYPDLDQFQKIYFNRLTSKLNYRVFFELFKWFDTSYSDLIESLMPKKTQFLGINYTIESHMLERHRHRYTSDQQYTIETVVTQDETGLDLETGTIIVT